MRLIWLDANSFPWPVLTRWGRLPLLGVGPRFIKPMCGGRLAHARKGGSSVPRQGLRRLLTLLTPERTLEVQVPHFGLTIVPSFDFSLAPKGSSALVLELVFFLCHATAASSGTQWPEPWQVLFPQRKGPTHAVEHARPSLPCFLVVQNRSLYYETWGRAQFSKLNSDDRGDRFAHGGDLENGEETAL